MASLGSSIRSAARATSSAYRRLPIRWRLAGGSAALTLVILCGFAAIVGVLTTRQIHEDFHDDVARSADRLARQVQLRLYYDNGQPIVRPDRGSVNLQDFASSTGAAIRVITEDDTLGYATPGSPLGSRGGGLPPPPGAMEPTAEPPAAARQIERARAPSLTYTPPEADD